MLDYRAIGRKIANCRKSKHLTQADLAEKLDISESYVSQVECGKVEISLKRLDKIADALGIELTALLTDTNPYAPGYGFDELYQLICKWSYEQKELLLTLVKSADDKIYPTDKKK